MMVSHPNILVDTIRLPNGSYFDISRDQVRGTRHSLPSICPRANPQPPEELLPDGDQLAEIEIRVRELGLICEDESIHLVGCQYRRESRCECELRPPALLKQRTDEWTTLRDLKSAIIAMTKAVHPYVEGRRSGQAVSNQDLVMFKTLAERVQTLAHLLSLPLPPVITNMSLAHGPTALPVDERTEGLIIAQEAGREWLTIWSKVRGVIDNRLALIDRAAQEVKPATPVSVERLVFEDSSLTILLDGCKDDPPLTPTAYWFLKTLGVPKRLGHMVPSSEITGHGLKGKKFIRVLRELPSRWRNLIKSASGSGGGYCLTLPPKSCP
jgi:hypothetical protein